MKATFLIAASLFVGSAQQVLAQSGQIAYVRGAQEHGEIWVYDLASKTEKPILGMQREPKPITGSSPSFSRDGQTLVYSGGGARRAIRDEFGEWSVDKEDFASAILPFELPRGFRGGRVPTTPDPRGFPNRARVSPSGRQAVFSRDRMRDGEKANALCVYSFDLKTEVEILPAGSVRCVYQPAWLTEDKIAVVAHGDDHKPRFFTVERQQGVWKVSDGPLFEGNVMFPVFLQATDSGNLLLGKTTIEDDGPRKNQPALMFYNLTTREKTFFESDTRDGRAAFSPDGKWLIYNEGAYNTPGQFSLWERTPAGQYRKTNSPLFSKLSGWNPVWSVSTKRELAALNATDAARALGVTGNMMAQAGEIYLSGTITSSNTATKRIVIAADKFVLPSAKAGTIQPAKTKALFITNATFIHYEGKGEKLTLQALNGAKGPIQVVGTDAGSGKPLQAREVILIQSP